MSSDCSARGCGYTASGWSEAPAAGALWVLRGAASARAAPAASSPRCWRGRRWEPWWWSAADVRYGCASRRTATAIMLAIDQRARCIPAPGLAGAGWAGRGRSFGGRGAGAGRARGLAGVESAAWVGQAFGLWLVAQSCAATCVFHGADIARGVAPAPSMIRSATIAEEAAGPGWRTGALSTSWARCHASVGRHASADAPTSRHHSSGQGACRRAGDCWGGGACGVACRTSRGGSGVGVGVGVRLGARVGSGSGLGGGVASESGGAADASVPMGTLGGAGSLVSPLPAVAGGWLW